MTDHPYRIISGRTAHHAFVRRAQMQMISHVIDGSVVPIDAPDTLVAAEVPVTFVLAEGPSTSTTSSLRPQDDGEGSSQTPFARTRCRDTSSTPVQPPADVGSPVPPPELHKEANAHEKSVGYPWGPSDSSLLTGDPQKFYTHDRKIASLVQPAELWFQDVLGAFRLKDLCQIGYHTTHNGMLMAFAERWHQETSSFHLPHGEITISLDNITCLLHIPIRGTLLGHGRLVKEEAVEVLIVELGADLEDALEEVERTCDTHVRFFFLMRQYEAELLATQQSAGNPLDEEIHRQQGWILQHFSMIIGWGDVSSYTKGMPRASAYITLRGNQVSDPYRYSIERMAAEDIRYDSYVAHHETVSWDDIALYSGWLAASSTIIVRYLPKCGMRKFGYCQTVPRDPFVFAPISMIHGKIDVVFAY
ncbi:uncharacterized protein LOC131638558 [Vicia villosa]|uniref:uncharacterized protein LOC131638558 n=1 Tax=Vicia villosa TaxID=3911 RepID=UPI00273BC484|nr:uncharacterized protein LOC131638558 [Vicia villosa]